MWNEVKHIFKRNEKKGKKKNIFLYSMLFFSMLLDFCTLARSFAGFFFLPRIYFSL